jgi:hypothetical protein
MSRGQMVVTVVATLLTVAAMLVSALVWDMALNGYVALIAACESIFVLLLP